MGTNINLERLEVILDIEDEVHHVGSLALSGRDLYFQYNEQFVSNGLEISPVHLPLNNKVYKNPGFLSEFEYVPGVFQDSLSDGWGLRLMDRWFAAQGIDPDTISVLDRLAYMGNRSMGAFRYEPEKTFIDGDPEKTINITTLAEESMKIAEGDTDEIIEDVMIAGGSPGGARPKALIGLNAKKNKAVHGVYNLPQGYEHYVVKFWHANENNTTGALEYVYSLMAENAGLSMPPTRLIESGNERYFAIKRFDREQNKRLHMHTLGGMLHSNFRVAEASYDHLFKAAVYLTNHQEQVHEVFRRMVFNVLSNNRDDHVHNFSFLMNKAGEWTLSPAYDLTYSPGMGGYHTLDIEGTKDPGREQFNNLGKRYDIKPVKIKTMVEEISEALSEFPSLAKAYDIDPTLAQQVGGVIDSHLARAA